jgi:hypothetical protein
MLESGYDLVYPYKKGSFLTNWNFNQQQLDHIFSQPNTLYLTHLLNKYPVFPDHPGLKVFLDLNIGKVITAGGCQCFNTESYKKGFGENENFIDWGPEDQERLYRFYILGFKIGFIENGEAIHMFHDISKIVKEKNLYYQNNHKLYDYITENIKTKQQMLDYMNSLEYTKKRNFI